MSETRVIIEKADGTGQASVLLNDFRKHYPDVKYKVLGDESPADFVVTGVPTPKPARKRPSAKKAAPVAAPVIASVPEPES